MRIHQKASANGSYWLDSTNERIEFTNFAGPQTQAGVACVVLLGNREYQWMTTDCLARIGSAAVCVTGKGEQHIERFRLGLKAGILQGLQVMTSQNLATRGNGENWF